MKDVTEQTVWFDDLGRGDVARVGGKNAALGEMIRRLAAEGVNVPPGFATTAAAYRRFIEANQLEPQIRDALAELRDGKASLAEAGARIRRAVLRGDWPAETAAADVISARSRFSAAVAPNWPIRAFMVAVGT